MAPRADVRPASAACRFPTPRSSLPGQVLTVGGRNPSGKWWTTLRRDVVAESCRPLPSQPSMLLAITSRWISLVPSYNVVMRASRYSRSTSYSLL